MIETQTALVIIPRYFNPDESGKRKRIESQRFMATARELTRLFGGCTWHRDPKKGFWGSAGIIVEDDVVVIEVDIDNSLDHKNRLLAYVRDNLLQRFRQEVIYVKFIGPVDTHMVELGEGTR